jgi:hypothetical protein
MTGDGMENNAALRPEAYRMVVEASGGFHRVETDPDASVVPAFNGFGNRDRAEWSLKHSKHRLTILCSKVLTNRAGSS